MNQTNYRYFPTALAIFAVALWVSPGVFAQTAPTQGQNQLRQLWHAQSVPAVNQVPLNVFFSRDGSAYAYRGLNLGATTIEVRRSSDNAALSSVAVFGTFTPGRKFFDLSADGSLLAVATGGAGNQLVRIYDVLSGSIIGSIQATWPGGASGATAVAFSPIVGEQMYLAVGADGNNPSVRVYQVGPRGAWDFQNFTTFNGPKSAPNWIDWNSDATRLAVAFSTNGNGNRLRVWNVSTPNRPLSGFIPNALGPGPNENRVYFSNAGNELLLTGAQGFQRFNVPAGTRISDRSDLGSQFRSGGYNAADTAFVGRPGSQLRDFNFNPNLVYTSFSTPEWISTRAMSNEFIVAANSVKSPIPGINGVPYRRFQFGNPSQEEAFLRTGAPVAAQLSNILVSADGESLFTGIKDSNGRRVLRYNAATGQVAATSATLAGDVYQIDFSLDRSVIYAAVQSNPGQIVALNSLDLTPASAPLSSSPAFSSMRGVAVVPAGPFAGNVYGLDSNGRITIFNSAGAQLSTAIPFAGAIPVDTAPIAMAPNGLSFYYYITNSVRKFAVGSQIGPAQYQSGLIFDANSTVGAIAVSPDSRRVALSRRILGGGVFPLCYDNTVVDSFSALVSSPPGISGTNIASLGITWLANDYYAFLVTNLGSGSQFHSLHLFPSEYSLRLEPSLSTVTNPAQLTYDKRTQRLFLAGYTNGDVTAMRMPTAPGLLQITAAGNMTGTQIFGVEILQTRNLGNIGNWELRLLADLSGDGREDLIWSNGTTQQTAFWTMVGVNQVQSRVYNTGSWEPVFSGDLNGDGNSDIVFRLGNQIAFWFMDGVAVKSSRVFNVAPEWVPVATGDFNGDGIDDLVWQNSSNNNVAIWLMNETGRPFNSAAYPVPAGFTVFDTGDLNGNGRADLVFAGGTNGSAAWLMDSLTLVNSTYFVAANVVLQGVGDLNNDGKDDMVLIDTDGKLVFAYENIATGFMFTPDTVLYGTDMGDWRIQRVMDLNGDNKADLCWRNQTTNEIAVWTLTGTSPLQSQIIGAVPASTQTVFGRF